MKWFDSAEIMTSNGWRMTWTSGAAGNNNAISPRCISLSGILSVNHAALGSTGAICAAFCR